MSACPLAPADFIVLCDVIRYVTRNSGLAPADAEDFAQTVHLKLLERNYAPLTRFSGRSSLRTFLTVVVKRLLLDWRNASYGRWRPAAESRRHGEDAIALDRLIGRDGHPAAEAIAILEHRQDAPCPDTLRALAARLSTRRRFELLSVEDVQTLGDCKFQDPIEAANQSADHRRTMDALRQAYQTLDAADRRILRLRFKDNMTITAIAALLGTPVKPMFRQVQRILNTLRRELAASAISPATSSLSGKAASKRATATRVH